MRMKPIFPPTVFYHLPSAEERTHPAQLVEATPVIGKGGDERTFPLFP